MTFTLDKYMPYSVGFDTLFDRLGSLSAIDVKGYPYYNIKKADDTQWVFELALAGFSKDDIEIEVVLLYLIEACNIGILLDFFTRLIRIDNSLNMHIGEHVLVFAGLKVFLTAGINKQNILARLACTSLFTGAVKNHDGHGYIRCGEQVAR